MQSRQSYLNEYFFTKTQLADEAGVSLDFLEKAILMKVIPGASYTLRRREEMESHIFGKSEEELIVEEYYHRSSVVWVKKAKSLLENGSWENVGLKVKSEFEIEYRSFLKGSTKLSDDDISERLENTWKHFLKGTYGVCVINPDSPQAIAKKQLAAEKLTSFTENGEKESLTGVEEQQLRELIAGYNENTMPFAPWDYHLSSRKRLVDKNYELNMSN